MDTADIRYQLEKECGDTFTERGWIIFERQGVVGEFRKGELEWTDLQELAEEFIECRASSGGHLAPSPVISLRFRLLFQGAYPLFDLTQLLPLLALIHPIA
jgi:hypothetical protein